METHVKGVKKNQRSHELLEAVSTEHPDAGEAWSGASHWKRHWTQTEERNRIVTTQKSWSE